MSETEDIKSLKKSLEKIVSQYEELKKDNGITSKELQDARLELSKIRRRLQEAKTTRDDALRTKGELDIEYARINEVKKENEAIIRDLISKTTELQFKHETILSNKSEQEKKKNKDLYEVELEKESLKITQQKYDQTLEEERRALHSKFMDDKLDLKKTFQQEVDDLKLRHEKQMSEQERNRRRILSEITDTAEKKIITLEHESHQLHTKLDNLNRTTANHEATIADLEKNLRRELLNVDVMGTSKIDWIKEQSTPSEMVRQFKIQDKKIQQLRQKLNQTESEVDFETRQTDHAENLVKELQREFHEQELYYQRLEATKDDLEKRLTDRVEQLERELNSKNVQLEAEFLNVQVQLEASITDKDELIQALKTEIAELSELAKETKVNTQKVSTKLGQKLDSDRILFMELERARRDAAAEARSTKKELEELKEQEEHLKLESTKYKKQYADLTQQIEMLQSNNQKLERAGRRLMTRV